MKALVTGATHGIGKAIALELGKQGYEVVVHGRSPERGAETVQAIVRAGGKARFVAADLTRAQDVLRLAKDAGDVDVLVNNAGIAAFAATAEMGAEAFDNQFNTNVRAPFLLVGVLAPAMAARKNGSIINIGSMAGAIGMAGGAAYGATKAAITSMTQAWAAEYSAHGVRINNVAPGPIEGIHDNSDFAIQLGQTTAMKRPGTTQEVAEVVAFLASPKAAYITGATIAVDGGRTAI